MSTTCAVWILSIAVTVAEDDAALKELAVLYPNFDVAGAVTHDENVAGNPVVEFRCNGPFIRNRAIPIIARFKRMRTLDLHYCTSLLDEKMDAIAGLGELETLDLYSTRISDSSIEHFLTLKRLRKLDVGRTRVSEEGVARLAKCVQLSSLGIGDLKVTDATLEQLKALVGLETLDSSRTLISDDGAKTLPAFARLRSIDLSGCKRISGACCSELAKMETLRHLKLSFTKIDDEGVKALLPLRDLRTLSLSELAISDETVETLSQLKELEVLSVSGTDISAEGIAELQRALPKCKVITARLIPLR